MILRDVADGDGIHGSVDGGDLVAVRRRPTLPMSQKNQDRRERDDDDGFQDIPVDCIALTDLPVP